MSTDKTKQVLEQLLAELYEKQSATVRPQGSSFVEAQNGQFLGKITTNKYDNESILNKYGPYGSRYSTTSIFNKYSDYGSRYGANSIHNPYCSTPPRLVINGQHLGYISANKNLADRIPTESFLYTLNNNVKALLAGQITESEREALKLGGKSYIEAGDGTFLGKLTPNQFDQDSIFNQFGTYGNQFSPSSIFNQFSKYGNQFNPLSPFNEFSNNPPKLFVKGKFVAFLTKNKFKKPRVDPDEILSWAKQNVSQYTG
jgi:hypothetical protein